MKYPSQIIDWAGRKITLTWIKLDKDSDLNKFKPITQAYGICFNDQGEILVLDQKGGGEWTLPGGTVEERETPLGTLVREVMEEADVTLNDIFVLGVQRVEDPQNTGPKGKLHYQARFVAKIDQVLPQTVDPAKGRIHQRKFIPSSQINRYIKWGNTGEAIFADSTRSMLVAKTGIDLEKNLDCRILVISLLDTLSGIRSSTTILSPYTSHRVRKI